MKRVFIVSLMLVVCLAAAAQKKKVSDLKI
mgnify:CR=1 FL=1